MKNSNKHRKRPGKEYKTIVVSRSVHKYLIEKRIEHGLSSIDLYLKRRFDI